AQQQAIVESMEKLISEIIAFVAQAVETRDEVGPEAATTVISRAAGKHQMDRVRELARQIHESQTARLESWADHARQSFETALATFIMATPSAMALMAVVFVLVRRDIQATQRHTARLAASEARFRRLVDANVMGVLFTDLEGRIVDANDAFL